MHHCAVISIAALIFFILSIFEPFLSLSILGINQEMRLISIFTVLHTDWILLLYVCVLFTFLFPLFMLFTIIGTGLFNLKVTPIIGEIYAFSHRFCMIDVFILGVLVSLIKLTALVEVEFHSGFILSGIFSVMMIWLYTKVKPQDIWNKVKSANIDNYLEKTSYCKNHGHSIRAMGNCIAYAILFQKEVYRTLAVKTIAKKHKKRPI